MQKTAIQLRRDLKEIWPRLRHIWFFDRSFDLPHSTVLEDLANRAKIIPVLNTTLGDLYNQGDIWDCDDFAMLSAALIRLMWKQDGSQLPIPYGRAMGNQFRSMPILHSLNICFCSDGIYFVDFDDGGRIWKADSENDSIFFVSV